LPLLHGQSGDRWQREDLRQGTLADAPTREARKRAKAVFNPLWQSKRMTRNEAYRWLAGALCIAKVEECHIGWFDVQTCQRAVSACLELAKGKKQ
jgi:hypothetical protein